MQRHLRLHHATLGRLRLAAARVRRLFHLTKHQVEYLGCVSEPLRTDVGIVPRAGLDPGTLELLRELLALCLGHLPAW